jgi:hypothetical protein
MAAGPPVAVLGLYRSGSSCVAGILHHLGLHVGTHLAAGNRNNEAGYFEPLWLSRQLRQLCDEPRLAEMSPREFRVGALRHWLRQESKVAASAGKRLAAKHPLLCMLGDEIIEAWGTKTQFISIVRPLAESARSLDRTGWWQMQYRKPLLRSLWDAREAFLAKHEHLQIDFGSLLVDPRSEITRIVGFLGVASDESQFEAAVNFVRRSSDVKAACSQW